MNRARRAALILALSAACGWAGHALAAARRPTSGPALSQESAGLSPSRSRETTSASTAESGPAGEQARAIARCDTADLWKWLQETPDPPEEFANGVIRELMDRQGVQAVRQALQISDPAACSRLSEQFLNAWFTRDPWAAFDLYLAERGRFDSGWAGEGLSAVNRAAAAISAEKLIEVQKATAGSSSRWVAYLEYPADFDFRLALDFFSSGQAPNPHLSEGMAQQWASKSPAEAAAWLAEHPDGGQPNDTNSSPRIVTDVIRVIAVSGTEAPATALNSLMRLPPELRKEAWRRLPDPGGRLDPALLSAATTMETRMTYLTISFDHSRSTGMLDPSWASLSASERSAVIDEYLAESSSRPQTPAARKALDRWTASARQQSAALGN